MCMAEMNLKIKGKIQQIANIFFFYENCIHLSVHGLVLSSPPTNKCHMNSYSFIQGFFSFLLYKPFHTHIFRMTTNEKSNIKRKIFNTSQQWLREIEKQIDKIQHKMLLMEMMCKSMDNRKKIILIFWIQMLKILK